MPEARAQEGDYYALLGVSRDATADQIRQAFHRFARTHHPDNFGSAREAREEAERLYRHGTEAYRVLMDHDKRRRYDEGLAKGQLRYVADRTQQRRPTGSGPELRSPKARMFYGKARKAAATGDFAQAKLNLQMALNHDPDNEELRAELEALKTKMRK